MTKGEEQVIKVVWQQPEAFLKAILELMPEPKHHINTVATTLKILVNKGFVITETTGHSHLYSPLVSKAEYNNHIISKIVTDYFEGSAIDFVNFMVERKLLTAADLELLVKELKP